MEVRETLTFSQALSESLNKITQFSGRSRRSEYWWTMLIVFAVSAFVPIIGGLLSLAAIPLTFRRLHDTGRSGWWWGVGAIIDLAFWIIFCVDLMLAISGSYAVSQIEDYASDASAAFSLMGGVWAIIMKYFVMALICFAYKVVLLVFLCQDSEQEENEYGASPKYYESDPVSEQQEP